MRMKWLANWLMTHRAHSLFTRLSAHLPSTGTLADIGSGTGHNAAEIRKCTSLRVCEFDVADLHWLGEGPTIISANHVPVCERTFDGVLMLFILHYLDSPQDLLVEARRISRFPIILLQSTYCGWWGRAVLVVREFLWGRMAWKLATIAGVIRSAKCPLLPRRYFTRAELLEVFEDAGFRVVTIEAARWLGLGVSRDLYVLESNQS